MGFFRGGGQSAYKLAEIEKVVWLIVLIRQWPTGPLAKSFHQFTPWTFHMGRDVHAGTLQLS
jgi:hypothetical protein